MCSCQMVRCSPHQEPFLPALHASQRCYILIWTSLLKENFRAFLILPHTISTQGVSVRIFLGSHLPVRTWGGEYTFYALIERDQMSSHSCCLKLFSPMKFLKFASLLSFEAYGNGRLKILRKPWRGPRLSLIFRIKRIH